MQDMDMRKTTPMATDEDRKMWIRPVLGMLALDETAEAVGSTADFSGLS